MPSLLSSSLSFRRRDRRKNEVVNQKTKKKKKMMKNIMMDSPTSATTMLRLRMESSSEGLDNDRSWLSPGGGGFRDDNNSCCNNNGDDLDDDDDDDNDLGLGFFEESESESRFLNIERDQFTQGGHQFTEKVNESRRMSSYKNLQIKLDEHSITLNKLNWNNNNQQEEETEGKVLSLSLVGREKEIQQLNTIYENYMSSLSSSSSSSNNSSSTTTTTSSSTSCVVSIVGASGTGKTVLAKQLLLQKQKQQYNGGSGGYFCLGKFDFAANNNNKSSPGTADGGTATMIQPYTAFAKASYELSNQIKQQQQQQQMKNNDLLRQQIYNAVGGTYGIQLLLEVFPGLANILVVVDDDENSSSSSSTTTNTKTAAAAATATTTATSSSSTAATKETSLEQKSNQLQYTVRQLIRVLVNNNSNGNKKTLPFVLVLDDIQWADIPSLNLIESLLTDRESSIMLITTCRCSEEDDDSSSSLFPQKLLKAIQSKKIPMETLKIGNLSESSVQSLIASSMNETEDYTNDLASIVYEKTNGNIFFVKQYMNMLVNESLLTYNIGLMKWMWQDDTIQSLRVADNVGNLLSRQITTKFDINTTQVVIKIASCLGQSFEEETLSVALMNLGIPSTSKMVSDALQECIDYGVLEHSGSKYTFVHDQIQATAYNLIPKDELPSMQLKIGRGLLLLRPSRYYNSATTIRTSTTRTTRSRSKTSYNHHHRHHLYPKDSSSNNGDNSHSHSSIINDDDGVMFLAIDLCNSGMMLLDDEGKKGLALENWRAAEKAMHKSAFDAAISYGKSGLRCLDGRRNKTTTAGVVKQQQQQQRLDDDDDDDDDQQVKVLKLKLHVSLAEASFCIGDASSTEVYAERIIANDDFSFDDKFDGYVCVMLSQFAQQKMDDATNTSLYILRELGYVKNLGTKPGTFRVLTEIIKTKNLMKSYTKDDLMNLPQMTDKNRLRGINVIYRSSTVLHGCNPNMFLILFLIAMRWTVKYGVSKYSPPIFSIYGLVVCGVLEDFENGMMIGDVALALGERLKASPTVAATTSIVFSFVYHWKKDLRSARPSLEYGYRAGLQAGDINNAISIMIMLDQNSFMSSFHNLNELADLFQESVAKIRELGHEYFAVEHSIVWQIVLNLQGKAEDPFVLTGDAMNQEQVIKDAIATNHKMVITSINSWSGILGYLYENHEFAVERMTKVDYKDCLGYVSMPRQFSFLALAHVGLALQGEKPKYNLKQARILLNKKLKKWVSPGNVNILHLVTLVEAEIASLSKSPHLASPLYEEAIRLASRSGFRNDKATAHARAARFFFEVQNDSHLGSYHLDKSIQAYCEWGAIGVAKNLAKVYVDTPGASHRFWQEVK